MTSVSSMAVASAVLLGLCSTALAEPIQTTRYDYYPVSGDTAGEIYAAMLSRGPEVNGAKAYAATSATTTQDGKLLQSDNCKILDYRLRLNFTIRLPKIRNEKALPQKDLKRWRQFSAFLKHHEETHRSIWLGCAAELEKQVKLIQVKSCRVAEKKATQLWEKMRTACNLKHSAFDTAEQKRLMAHPFVRLVYGRGTTTHAAKVK